MLWSIYGTVNSAESGEFTGAVKYPVLKAGNSVLLAAKMVIKNPEEVNAPIVNRKQSKEYFHRVTGHAGHHLMDATVKYYKVDLTSKVNNCLSCSLEKIKKEYPKEE